MTSATVDKKPRKSKRIAEKIKELLAERDRGKEAYNRARELEAELADELEVGEPIDLGDGQTAKLVDRFAGKNTVFKPCGVTRFEIEVSRG